MDKDVQIRMLRRRLEGLMEKLQDQRAVIDAQRDYIQMMHDKKDNEKPFTMDITTSIPQQIHNLEVSTEEMNEMNNNAMYNNFLITLKKGGIDVRKGENFNE